MYRYGQQRSPSDRRGIFRDISSQLRKGKDAESEEAQEHANSSLGLYG